MSQDQTTAGAEECLKHAYMHLGILEDTHNRGQQTSPRDVLRWLAEAVNELIQVEKRRG